MPEKPKVEQWMREAADEWVFNSTGVRYLERREVELLANVIAAHAPTPAPEPTRKIDGKFSMKYGTSGGHIVNTVSGEVIPEDEPLFLIRGRDNNAIACITSYLNICKKRGCNDLHLAGIQQTLDKFVAFSQEHPERMKQPGITKHLELEAAPAAAQGAPDPLYRHYEEYTSMVPPKGQRQMTYREWQQRLSDRLTREKNTPASSPVSRKED